MNAHVVQNINIQCGVKHANLPITYALSLLALRKYVTMSMGNGNTIVEFFSADIVFKV